MVFACIASDRPAGRAAVPVVTTSSTISRAATNTPEPSFSPLDAPGRTLPEITLPSGSPAAVWPTRPRAPEAATPTKLARRSTPAGSVPMRLPTTTPSSAASHTPTRWPETTLPSSPDPPTVARAVPRTQTPTRVAVASVPCVTPPAPVASSPIQLPTTRTGAPAAGPVRSTTTLASPLNATTLRRRSAGAPGAIAAVAPSVTSDGPPVPPAGCGPT